MLSVKATAHLNKQILHKKVKQQEPQTLKSAGAYVRAVVRNSIKTRKNRNKNSAPGSPPFSHPDNKGMQGFKKTIVFGVDLARRSVLVGPKKVVGGLNELARVHEFGGTRYQRVVDEKFMDNGVAVGDIAPLRGKFLTKKDVPVRRAEQKDPLTGDAVYWVKIRTRSQAEHASRLYRRMAKLLAEKTKVKYPARPFMRPGLKKSLPALSRFWVNAIQ